MIFLVKFSKTSLRILRIRMTLLTTLHNDFITNYYIFKN